MVVFAYFRDLKAFFFLILICSLIFCDKIGSIYFCVEMRHDFYYWYKCLVALLRRLCQAWSGLGYLNVFKRPRTQSYTSFAKRFRFYQRTSWSSRAEDWFMPFLMIVSTWSYAPLVETIPIAYYLIFWKWPTTKGYQTQNFSGSLTPSSWTIFMLHKLESRLYGQPFLADICRVRTKKCSP